MKLIAILIGLAVDRFFGNIAKWRHFVWLDAYASWLHRQLPYSYAQGAAAVIAVVAVPALILGLIVHFGNIYFGLVLSIGFLLYCIGPKQLEHELGLLLQADATHDEAMMGKVADSLTSGKHYQNADDTTAGRIIDAVLVEANDRYYAVLFWFVLLGPAGALAYRCASRYSQSQQLDADSPEQRRKAAALVHKLLDWLPANLAALSYAITGSFIHAAEQWRLNLHFDPKETVNAAVLIHSGRGAVLFHHIDDSFAVQMQAIIALIWRTIWLWVVCAAVVTLAGWIG